MPILIKIYIFIYLILIFSNLGYWIYTRAKISVILYDFTSSICVFVFMLAYWRPVLMEELGLFHVTVFMAIIIFEFYMSTFGNPEIIGFKIPDGIEKKEIENAKIFSLIFSSPAYIIGSLVSFEVIKKALFYFLRNIQFFS